MSERPAKTIGIAIIGSGFMAKSHTMAFRNVGAVYGSLPFEARLVVLCDASDELARAGAESLGYERWTSNWREAIEDSEVDLVDIVTPNYLHKEMALAAAAAGKHIYCEKPLALTADDAREMFEAAERAGVCTMVGFTYLRNPAVELALRLVRAGDLGEIYSFTGTFALDAIVDPKVPFSWRLDRKLAGTGALGDLGAHVIAWARALVGDIERVCASGRTFITQRPDTQGVFGYGEAADASLPLRRVENDDVMLFLCEFSNGACGSVEANRVASGRAYELSFTLTGSKGAARFSQQEMHKLELYLDSDAPERRGFRSVNVAPGHGDYGRFWPIAGVNIGGHELKVFEVHDLLAAVAQNRPATPDFREGWEVCRVIDAVERSSHERRWIDVV